MTDYPESALRSAKKTTTSPDVFSSLDKTMATFLGQRCVCKDEAQRERFELLVKLLCAAQSRGDSCIHVLSDDQQILQQSGVVSEPEREECEEKESNLPLVLENNRLYLKRYWQYETDLVELIKNKITHPPAIPENLPSILDRYFNGGDQGSTQESSETDWQREAANNVVQQSFSIITGGPGTGKTTTILKILGILQEIHQGELLIALAAPTGKAAMRLQQSLADGKLKLAFPNAIHNAIPTEVSTIHRLLGTRSESIYFHHNADNPLVHDLVVIDEASMVDLALMSKLVSALKPDARLLLVGDKDQLASVESGAVLNDLSAALVTHTSELKKTWRFVEGIKNLALAINQQDSHTAWQLLNDADNEATRLVTVPLITHIMQASAAYFDYVQAMQSVTDASLDQLFEQFNRFQVLCSNRQGSRGVEGINRDVEHALQARGVQTYYHWYHGKPVLITRNDTHTQLYNGDIGICLREYSEDIGQYQYYIYFPRVEGGYKKLLPARLPQHETAYALTIHKSQGSEFERVLVVLPDSINPVLSKELVYTAITRAKQVVEISSSEEVFTAALQRRVERNSGLQEKLAYG